MGLNVWRRVDCEEYWIVCVISTNTGEEDDCSLNSSMCLQTLAGSGLPDHLHHWTPWHAEAARGVLAITAQLSSWDDLLLRRSSPWSAAAEDHFSQEPHPRGACSSQDPSSQYLSLIPGAVFTGATSNHTVFSLCLQCHIKINSAYGSMKDICVYNMLGLGPAQIFIVGRPSKKYQNQCQVHGLSHENNSGQFCPEKINSPGRGFSLHGGHL